MFHSTMTLSQRTAATVGGLAVVGSMGAGMAAQASAAQGSAPNATLAAIRHCESHDNYRAQNPASTASGAYQFLTSTWRTLSAAKGYPTAASAPKSVQDAAALEMYRKAGTSPWAASSSCWAK